MKKIKLTKEQSLYIVNMVETGEPLRCKNCPALNGGECSFDQCEEDRIILEAARNCCCSSGIKRGIFWMVLVPAVMVILFVALYDITEALYNRDDIEEVMDVRCNNGIFQTKLETRNGSMWVEPPSRVFCENIEGEER